MASVEVVGTTGYLAFLETVKESTECCTHLSLVHSTVHGRFTGFVKLYPDTSGRSKGLVNEACGYLLAKAAGIPVPVYGMLLLVRGERLREAHPTQASTIDRSIDYPTWVTQRVNGVPVNSHDETTLQSLRKWSFLPQLIAFDDWVFNADRSLQNLMYERKDRFTAIDHGHVLGGIQWDPTLLTPDIPLQHPFIGTLWHSGLPAEMKSAVLESSRTHRAVFERARGCLDDILGKLLDETEKKHVLEFLEYRALHGYDRMRKSLGVLI